MTTAQLLADAVILAVVLSAAAAGLLAHLLWLLVTDPRALVGLGAEVMGL